MVFVTEVLLLPQAREVGVMAPSSPGLTKSGRTGPAAKEAVRGPGVSYWLAMLALPFVLWGSWNVNLF
jgi:hypothetical protein